MTTSKGGFFIGSVGVYKTTYNGAKVTVRLMGMPELSDTPTTGWVPRGAIIHKVVDGIHLEEFSRLSQKEWEYCASEAQKEVRVFDISGPEFLARVAKQYWEICK